MARIRYSAGDGSSFTPLPNGTYDLRINETVQGTSSKGNPQLQLKCEVIDGPDAGKNISVWYSLTPKAGWKLDKLLDALGIEREETGEVDEDGKPILDFDDEWLLNRCVTYDVTQREWNGRMNNNFDNERVSEYDAEAADTGATEAEGSAGQPATETPAAAPNTMRRRPRPQQGN